jgi:hypothetical protein
MTKRNNQLRTNIMSYGRRNSYGGGGYAGLRAAIEAYDCGSHVLVVSKSRSKDHLSNIQLMRLRSIFYLGPVVFAKRWILNRSLLVLIDMQKVTYHIGFMGLEPLVPKSFPL